MASRVLMREAGTGIKTGGNDGKNNSEGNECYCLCVGHHYWSFIFDPY